MTYRPFSLFNDRLEEQPAFAQVDAFLGESEPVTAPKTAVAPQPVPAPKIAVDPPKIAVDPPKIVAPKPEIAIAPKPAEEMRIGGNITAPVPEPKIAVDPPKIVEEPKIAIAPKIEAPKIAVDPPKIEAPKIAIAPKPVEEKIIGANTTTPPEFEKRKEEPKVKIAEEPVQKAGGDDRGPVAVKEKVQDKEIEKKQDPVAKKREVMEVGLAKPKEAEPIKKVEAPVLKKAVAEPIAEPMVKKAAVPVDGVAAPAVAKKLAEPAPAPAPECPPCDDKVKAAVDAEAAKCKDTQKTTD